MSLWTGAQLSSQEAVNNGGDNRDAMSVARVFLALYTDPEEG